jgi:hypothetical protein
MTIEVMMMIAKNCLLLQNLQAFIDVEIIAVGTNSCHGRG